MKTYFLVSQPNLLPEQRKRLENLGELIMLDSSQLSEDEVIKIAYDADILIAGSAAIKRISDKIINNLNNLKFISLLSVGTAWVDLESARAKKVLVSNIKGANSESVAEHAWGMILDLAKKISEFDREVRIRGAYKFGEFRGKEVYGKTIGIIGVGDIGSKVARIAKGFNMKILGFNKSGKKVPGIKIVDLTTLLSSSDIVVVSIPLDESTQNLISFKEIDLMKDGVIISNISLEGIVNKEAIINGIKLKKIFGYGVETDIMKPLDKNDEYLKYPSILVNIHNAFNTFDADLKSYDLMIENIEKFLEGKPQNLV